MYFLFNTMICEKDNFLKNDCRASIMVKAAFKLV